MSEPFVLSVSHKAIEYAFKERFERWGHTHRIAVLINESTFVFEPDEEGGYRALSSTVAIENTDISLVRAIAEKLAALSK